MSMVVCVECAHKMRSSKTPAAKAPGTRTHAGHGLCTRCYAKSRYTPAAEQEPAEDFDLRLAVLALDGFLAERRRRLARA